MMEEKSNFVLFLATFLTTIALSTVYIAIPLFAIQLGADPLNLGGLGFTSNLCFICFCLLFGKLSDRWKRKNIILLGFVGYSLASFLLSFSSHLYQLFIFIAFLGISGAMFWPSLEAWLAERSGKRLLKQIAHFDVSWSMGAIIGPLIGGSIFQIFPRFPFYIAGFFYLAIFFLILREPSKTEYKASSNSKKSSYKENGDHATSSFYLYLAWIATFASYFSLGILRYIFPKLFTEMGFTPLTLGILMSTIPASQALIFCILGQTSRWHYRLVPLLSAQLLIVFALILIFLSNSLPIFFLSFMFVGIGIGICSFSSLFYSVNTYRNRGARAAIHEAFLGSGLLIGPLVGGIVAQIYNLKTPYLTAVLMIIVLILVEITLILKRKSLI
ncbi:MAG: MFS transporter [Candidatus Aerophobetes bacterium]|nr:MFS transporter [Candidatus Aerophobetes bacterium]